MNKSNKLVVEPNWETQFNVFPLLRNILPFSLGTFDFELTKHTCLCHTVEVFQCRLGRVCNSTPFDLIFAWTTFLFQIFTSCCHRKWTKSGHFEVFFKITQLLFLYVYNSTTSYGKSRYLQAAHLSFRSFLKNLSNDL